MGNKLRHEGDEVRIKVIWPDSLIYIYRAKHLFANHVPWESMGKPQSMCSLLEGSNCENVGIRKKKPLIRGPHPTYTVFFE